MASEPRRKKYNNKAVIQHSFHHLKCLIPRDEALLAMSDLSDNAFKLLIYYYSRTSGWTFSDSEIAKTLGITERTVNDNRKELIKKKYLLITSGEIDNYFVGKDIVRKWMNPKDEDLGDIHRQLDESSSE